MFATEIPEDALWTEFLKGGTNCFFLILLSYCWWGSAVHDADGNAIEPGYSKWIKAFYDVEWVLVSMVKSLDRSLKRIREEAAVESSEDEASRVRKQYDSSFYVFPF